MTCDATAHHALLKLQRIVGNLNSNKYINVKFWSLKSYLSFKTLLELSFNRLLSNHMLQGMLKISCQQNIDIILRSLSIRRICRPFFLVVDFIDWSLCCYSPTVSTDELAYANKEMESFSPGR